METAQADRARPRVVLVAYVWCGFLALLDLNLGVVTFALMDRSLPDSGTESVARALVPWILLGFILLLAVAYAILPALPLRRWVWIYGIVLLGLASTSFLTAPVSIPVLVFWTKTRVREYFNAASPRATDSLAPVF